MTSFAKVTEYNDCEGELWTFWVQLEGNEEQLAHLNRLVEENVYDHILSVDMNCVETEEVVDILVRHAADGYWPSHSKLKGKLKLPKEPKKKTADWFKEYFYRNLYKGRIEKHVK
jgi:hypothetical protein|nr:MAG TPA: hypothetical protein [Caudoviricetes sp.]